MVSVTANQALKRSPKLGLLIGYTLAPRRMPDATQAVPGSTWPPLLPRTDIPLPPKVTIARRIALVGNPRIALTLLCTWLYQSGHFIIYTCFAVVFDRSPGP